MWKYALFYCILQARMDRYFKHKPAWLQLFLFGSLTFGIYLSIGLVAFYSIASFYQIAPEHLQELDWKDPAVLSALKLLQAVLSVVTFLLPALIFAYLSDRRPLQYLGAKRPVPAKFWWLGALLLILAFPLASWVNQLNQQLHLPAAFKATEDKLRAAEESANKLTEAMLDMKGPADLALMLIIIGFLPAICEEFFFRGVLQRLFIQIMKRPWAGIIITAIIFSAFHGQFLGFFTRVLLGILLGAACWYSGSIWPSVIAHFANNALQVIYVYRDKSFVNKEPQIAPILIMASALAVVLIIGYMRRISHTHFGEVYDTDDDLILPFKEGES